MSIKGVGIDFICINENNVLDKKFINLVLSKKEYAIFEKLKNNERKTEFFWGRLVSKEALVKAFGKRFFNFSDVNILNDEYGKPSVSFNFVNRKIKMSQIFISIAHNKKKVVAIVILC